MRCAYYALRKYSHSLGRAQKLKGIAPYALIRHCAACVDQALICIL
jgi:hypothetical protein